MRNTNMVMIDGEALKYEFFKRKMSMQEVSLELGMSRGYVKNSIASGKVRMFLIKYLSDTYGIDPVKYVLRENEEKEVEPEQDTRKMVTSEDVSEIIGELRVINTQLAKIILALN